MFGGNVFGWTADEATSFKLLDALRRRRPQLHRHGRRLFALGAGPQGRRVRDHHRQLAEGARRARQGRASPPRSAWRWAPARRACRKAYILRARRGLAASACRPTTSTSTSRTSTTRRRRSRRRCGAYADADRAGQGARDRRLQLHGAARWPRRSSASAASKLPRYESLQPHYNLYERAGYEARAGAAVPARRTSASSPTTRWPAASSPASTAREADLGKSPRGGGVKKYLNERGLRILTALDEVAARTQRQRRRRSRSPG